MSRRGLARAMVLLGISLLVAAPVTAGHTWRVVLPDTAKIDGGTALLRDISAVPVPSAAIPKQVILPNSLKAMVPRAMPSALTIMFAWSETCNNNT